MLNNIKTSAEIDAELLTQAQDSAIKEINETRDLAIASGVVYDGNTYQTDDKSITELGHATQIATANALKTVDWFTADNATVTLSLLKLKALGLAVFTHKTTHVYAARAKKDAVLAATTVQEVETALNS